MTCCRTGFGRTRVLVVRNPFSRLLSVFRLRWLGNEDMVHNRWEDFHVLARYVSEVFNSSDAYKTLPLLFGHGVLDTTGKWGEFKQWDLLHTRSISEWLQDTMLPEPLQVRTFHIVYVERL